MKNIFNFVEINKFDDGSQSSDLCSEKNRLMDMVLSKTYIMYFVEK